MPYHHILNASETIVTFRILKVKIFRQVVYSGALGTCMALEIYLLTFLTYFLAKFNSHHAFIRDYMLTYSERFLAPKVHFILFYILRTYSAVDGCLPV